MEKKKPQLSIVKKGKARVSPDSPPRALGRHGSQLWTSIVAEWFLDDAASVETLAQACAALDRAEECAALVAQDGVVIRLKSGQVREHPALRAELSNRSFVVRTLARLGLTSEAVKPVGRPTKPLGFQPDW